MIYDKVVDALLESIKEDKAKAIHGETSIKSYIYSITRNKCNDYFRKIERDKKRLLKEPFTKIINPEDDQYDSLYRKSISDANATPLTEDELRKLFMKLDLIRMLKGDNLPIAIQLIQGEKRGEIAEDLGLGIDQVRGKIARVRKKMNDPSISQALKEMIRKQNYRPRKKWRKTAKREKRIKTLVLILKE